MGKTKSDTTANRSTLPVVSAIDARRLLLSAQGLLDDPKRKLTSKNVLELITRMGFLQLDTINIVDRAHHLTMYSRLDDFRPRHLDALYEGKRKIFEHWTHDVSIIPAEFFPYWKPRFPRWKKNMLVNKWLARRLGDNAQKTIRHMRKFLKANGPVMSKDFKQKEGKKSNGWWDWKIEKAALEYLFWIGEVSVLKRVQFHKVYDLTDRVMNHWNCHSTPNKRDFIHWTAINAIERLGVATHNELAAFWGGININETKHWCEQATKQGEIIPVLVESADGSKPKQAYAVYDWEKRVKKLPAEMNRTRLLSPFDPIIRDRNRLKRLFDFDYRFEAFVPEAKRIHGYYVLPIMEGERFVGRVDPKFHRDKGQLVIRKVFWDEGVKDTKKRKTGLESAIIRLAKQIGAETWKIGK